MQLELNDLRKTYLLPAPLLHRRGQGKPKTKQALAGVSITLGPGLYGLLGPNGAGKSTLIGIITGGLALLICCPRPPCGRPAHGIAFRRVLGYMPQQQGLYDSYTGRRFLAYMAALKEIPRAAVPGEVARVAAAVNLTDELDKRLAAYSGGMKQRAMIAMGIIAGADMILADEPTKGLDEERIEMVVDAFHSLKDQAVLCVTHDLNFAREISDSISVMYASNQVEYASAKELLEHPLHPYTQDMIAAMPENGLHFSEGFAMAHEDYAEGGCKYAPRCRFCKEKCKETPPTLEVEGHQVRCWLYTGKEGECHASDNGKARKPL